MKSNAIKLFQSSFLDDLTITRQQKEFVDAVFVMCEENYENGGDSIVECFTPSEILIEFKSIDEAKNYCRLKVEQGTNCRLGENSDQELSRLERFKSWA